MRMNFLVSKATNVSHGRNDATGFPTIARINRISTNTIAVVRLDYFPIIIIIMIVLYPFVWTLKDALKDSSSAPNLKREYSAVALALIHLWDAMELRIAPTGKMNCIAVSHLDTVTYCKHKTTQFCIEPDQWCTREDRQCNEQCRWHSGSLCRLAHISGYQRWLLLYLFSILLLLLTFTSWLLCLLIPISPPPPPSPSTIRYPFYYLIPSPSLTLVSYANQRDIAVVEGSRDKNVFEIVMI